MKIKLLIIAVVGLAVGLTSGCKSFSEGYKAQGWTPSGMNYTLARDRKTGEQTDYLGVSWDLK